MISTATGQLPMVTYPLLGPLFIGCLLKQHRAPVRLQLEQASGPFSEVASQRICRSLVLCVTARKFIIDSAPSFSDTHHTLATPLTVFADSSPAPACLGVFRNLAEARIPSCLDVLPAATSAVA